MKEDTSAEDAALIARGAELDRAASPAPLDAAGQPPAPTDYAGEAGMLISTLVAIAGPFYPSVAQIWTADKQKAVAAAAAPVMEKYGFNFAAWMGEFAPEITLLIVAGPIVLDTIDGIKADRAAARKAAATPANDSHAAPPADS